MSIALLVAFEKNPYSGVVRPFINWANALRDRAIVAVYGCSDLLENYVRDKADLNGFRFVNDKSFHGLVRKLEHDSVDHLLSDDHLPRLKLLLEAKGQTGAKCVVYSQVLYGMHSIGYFHKDLLDFKTKLALSASSAFPFRFVSSRFKGLMRKMDTVVPNSRFTALMLNVLYGIEPVGVTYPPVDTHVFKPSGAKANEKEVLVYLGSNAGDTSSRLCQRVADALDDKVKIHLLGNERLYQKYLRLNKKLVYHRGVSDEELAELYSTVHLTVTPQIWETFGLVHVESLSCGTPVLTLYPHEALCEEAAGQIAYNEEGFIAKAEQLLIKHTDEASRQRCREIAMRFSVERSTSDLLKILETS
jgi:glycosyltransferase involved in cell wall biosynthesis